ncbi:hypothetical protein [Deinococcus sonorensis]|uniref:Terminase small subunit n=2 Tax=Deinococcus sonorensis TaxID=309891 RepID=A0AAU7UC63_9DEIO
MSNPNPMEARQAKRRKRQAQPGTLEDARALLWKALQRAGDILDSDDDTLSLKAIHAVSQGAAAYARIVEVGELEARLTALEAQAEGAGQLSSRGAA